MVKEEIAMKREELLELFKGKDIEGIEDIVGKIVDMNGKEITKKQKTIDDTIEKYKDYDDLKNKINTYEQGQMNDQEKLAKALKEAQETKLKYDREFAKLKVKNVFTENGLVEDDYKEVIESMNFDNEELALKCAAGFANLLKTKTEAASKKAKEDATVNAPTPPATKVEGEGKKTEAPKPFTAAEITDMYK